MRYRAFISYSGADRAIGERLQREVEHFRIPRSLRGRDFGQGAISKHLTPLFRDRSDASAGSDLGRTLHQALKDSEFLIVLGSPASARSRWVNTEIASFKALGRGDRIFSVLVDGRPHRYDPLSAPDGAFAPALFQKFDKTGAVISEDAPEPLAADVREFGDGFHIATLKIVAAITGIPLTLLTDRHREAEQREKTFVRIVAASMTVLAIAAVMAAILAWRSEKTAQRRLGAAVKMAASGLDDAVEFRDSYDVPAGVIRALLEGAQQDFGELIQDAGEPALELERVRLLTHFSDLYASLGEGEAQLKVAREALETVGHIRPGRRLSRPSTWFSSVKMSAIDTDRLNAMDALGVALTENDLTAEAWKQFQDGLMLAESTKDPLHIARFRTRLGEERYYRGDLPGARSEYNAAILCLDDLIRLGDDRAAEARQSQAGIRSDLANVLLESGLSGEALDAQKRAVETLTKEADRLHENTLIRQQLADALLRLGAIKYTVSGSWDASIPDFDEAIRILDDLHVRDSARMDYTRDLSIALERRGDVYLQQRQFDEATSDFGMMERLRRGIAAERPTRQSKRDLAVALERQASLAMASKQSGRTFGILNELYDLRVEAAINPKDFIAQRDLAITWNLIARARTQYCRPDWQAAQRESIRRMQSLLTMDSAPPGWMRDLAVFRTSFGDALYLAGRLPEARVQWSSALKLVTTHLAQEPKHALLPGDKALLEARMGDKSRPAALDCRLP